MLHNNIIRAYTTDHTDLTIDLVDESEKLSVRVHRTVLILLCPYFNKLLTSGCQESKQNQMTVYVPDVRVARDVIMSFYGETATYHQPQWQYTLELIKCADYFGLNIDKQPVMLLNIPTEGIELAIDVMDIMGYNENTLEWFIKNLPTDYDLKLIPPHLAAELIKYLRRIYLVMFDINHTMYLWDLKLDKWRDRRTCIYFYQQVSNTNHRHDTLAVIFNTCPRATGYLFTVHQNKMFVNTHFFINMTVTALSFTLDDKFLIVGGSDGSIIIYDVKVMEKEHMRLNSITETAMMGVYQLATGLLLSVGTNGQLMLWDLTTGKIIRIIRYADNIILTNISPDSTNIMICTTNTITIFKVDTLTFSAKLVYNGIISACCMSASNALLCVAGHSAVISVYDHNQQIVCTYQTSQPLTKVTQLYFIPDSNDMIIHGITMRSDDALVEKWNIHSKKSSFIVNTGYLPTYLFYQSHYLETYSKLSRELKNCAQQAAK